METVLVIFMQVGDPLSLRAHIQRCVPSFLYGKANWKELRKVFTRHSRILNFPTGPDQANTQILFQKISPPQDLLKGIWFFNTSKGLAVQQKYFQLCIF